MLYATKLPHKALLPNTQHLYVVVSDTYLNKVHWTYCCVSIAKTIRPTRQNISLYVTLPRIPSYCHVRVFIFVYLLLIHQILFYLGDTLICGWQIWNSYSASSICKNSSCLVWRYEMTCGLYDILVVETRRIRNLQRNKRSCK